MVSKLNNFIKHIEIQNIWDKTSTNSLNQMLSIPIKEKEATLKSSI